MDAPVMTVRLRQAAVSAALLLGASVALLGTGPDEDETHVVTIRVESTHPVIQLRARVRSTTRGYLADVNGPKPSPWTFAVTTHPGEVVTVHVVASVTASTGHLVTCLIEEDGHPVPNGSRRATTTRRKPTAQVVCSHSSASKVRW